MTVSLALLGAALVVAQGAASRAAGDEARGGSGWTVTTNADIEWCELRMVGDATFAFVATDSHELLVADLSLSADQNPRLRVTAGPGVRFAVDDPTAMPALHAPRRFYAFDLYTLFAIDVDASGQPYLTWRRGDWPAGIAISGAPAPDGSAFQGDPESLATIVGAALLDGAVLVARSDGRLSLCDAVNGEERQRFTGDAAGVIQLSVAGPKEAVALAKVGDGLEATFVGPHDGGFVAARRRVGAGWPILWRAVPGGLVAVWPDAAVFLRRDGVRNEVLARPLLQAFDAKLLDLWRPSALPALDARIESRLIAMDSAGAIAAFDTTQGRLVWARSVTAPPAPVLSFSPAALHVAGDYAIADDGVTLAYYAVRSGDVSVEAGYGRIRAATAVGDRLLYAAQTTGTLTPLCVAEMVVREVSASGGAGDPGMAIEPVAWPWFEPEASDVRWAGERLVTIGRRTVQALAYPRNAD